MKEWIKGMFNSDSPVSSNRIYAGLILASVVFITLVALFCGKSLDSNALITLGGMFAVCITGAVASKFSGQ